MSYSPHLPLDPGNRRPITVSVPQNSVCIQLARSFPEAAIRLGVMTNPAMVKGFEKLEKHVYKKAAHLSVISESFRTHCVNRGVPRDKVSVIPNYTDTEYITPQPKRSNHFRKTYKLNQRFVVQFSGRMGYSQGLETGRGLKMLFIAQYSADARRKWPGSSDAPRRTR